MSTVLVVDDEPAIRAVFDFVLTQGGFTVRLAAGGQEALELYKQDPASIDLVLLDIRMPGLDGLQTLAGLRQLNPSARCCFFSGHTSGNGRDVLLSLGALRVFEKPIPDLRAFVREVRQLVA